MLPETATRLQALLADLRWKVVLNVGSGTEDFFTVQQPYITERVLEPLLRNHNAVINVDTKAVAGVHIVRDVVRLGLTDFADIVLCLNLLEHVEDQQAALLSLTAALKPSGLLILEVPAAYPHHADPIDNGLRLNTAVMWDVFVAGLPLRRRYFELITRQSNPAHTTTLVIYERVA
jgi:SAM-dependent methyltransferase